MNLLRYLLARIHATAYRLLRPLLFRKSAQTAHERILALLKFADQSRLLCWLAETNLWLSYPKTRITVGGVELQHRFILAAGFVKGNGYASEHDAIQAVHLDCNIIPGWKVMPKLVGPVEFGSFTRHPRFGNSGTVMWRDVTSQSTQNRVGLKNPGAIAAAAFLQKNITELPHQFGINIAVSPGINDDGQAATEICESIGVFLQSGIIPNWFTLNLSCPNTEDDPDGNQTELRTKLLCEAALHQITSDGFTTPLWVKIGPDLSEIQYKVLLRVFESIGVRAVITSNTIAQQSPDDPKLLAGTGGGKLLMHAVHASKICKQEIRKCGYSLDVIGCGGIMDRQSYNLYSDIGIEVVQYWSALVYRGPLAAAIMESEVR